MTFGPITINSPGANATVGVMGPIGATGTPGTPGTPGAQGPAVFLPIVAWVSGTTYAPGTATQAASYVSIGGSSYACTTLHTSGVFAIDLAAGLWEVVGGKGDKGDPGTPGSTWYSGLGAPQPTVGINGDYFLRTDTYDVLLKVSNAWSKIGNLQGLAGNTVNSGTGAPASTIGVNGDFYLDTGAVVLYGPKAAGAWPASGTSLVGPRGSGTGNMNGPTAAITPGDIVTWGKDNQTAADSGIPLSSLALVNASGFLAASATPPSLLADPLAVAGCFPTFDYRLTAPDCVPPGQFSRLSTGYRTLPSGLLVPVAAGALRIDHDPVTGANLGALLEESRTNLLTYTTDIGAGGWQFGQNASPQGLVTAPDGTVSARVVRMTSTGNAYVSEAVSLVAGATYTFSGWFKLIAGTPGANGMLLATWSGGADNQIPYTSLTTSWQRFSTTFTMPSNTTAASFYPIHDMATSGNVDVAVWGLQLEAGAFPTSYIPTSSAQATRAADSLVVPVTSDWFNPNEGTLFLDALVPGGVSSAGFDGLIVCDDGTGSNLLCLYFANDGSVRFQVVSAGTASQATTGPLGLAAGVPLRISASYSAANVILSVNGTPVVAAAGSLAPVNLSNLHVGAYVGGAAPYTGRIRRAAYLPRAQSAAVLQQMTT